MTTDYCINCKHYIFNGSCLAFDKIPEDIIAGDTEHNKIIKGQDGDFTYDPKDKKNELKS